jgi:arabinofuranosyltransferase
MNLLTFRSDRRIEALLWLFLFFIAFRNAWLCEDAFITFRVVDNVLHGYGPRWNTLERVQVYSHPLWMLALCVFDFVTRDIRSAATWLSLMCSGLAMFLLLTRGTRSTVHAVLVATVLGFSKAFMDFSCSGLENPLAHLLLALFILEYLKPEGRRSFVTLVVWAGLAVTNRMDHVWLYLPAIAWEAAHHGYWRPRQAAKWVGLLLPIGWLAFSLLYYGFAFPSSAYAKLTVHVTTLHLMEQGLYYFMNSVAWDPLTLFATFAALGLVLSSAQKQPRLAMLATGVVLYFIFLVRIAGDYMSGRFFSAPLFVCMFLVSQFDFENAVQPLVALLLVLALGFTSPRPPITTTDTYEGLGSSPEDIDDERGYRAGETALLRLNRDNPLAATQGWISDGVRTGRDGVRIVIHKNIGYFGFYAGPKVYIIDPYGLGDALMGHIPFNESQGGWSAGHFYREVPDGFTEAALDKGALKDPALEAYWRKVEEVTRAPLFDSRRLALVFRFAVGLESALAPGASPAK